MNFNLMYFLFLGSATTLNTVQWQEAFTADEKCLYPCNVQQTQASVITGKQCTYILSEDRMDAGIDITSGI